MTASRSADSSSAVHDAIRSLHSVFSVEVTPREVRADPELLAALLPPLTRVYITALPNADFADTVTAAGTVHSLGLEPVPHIAARSVPSLPDLDRMIGQLAERGVHSALVIGGSVPRPVGKIGETMQVLGSGLLEKHGFSRVDVAGHPEGTPDITAPEVDRALRDKNEYAAATPLDVNLVTQFLFAPAPVVEWEKRIRAAGNTLPIRVGLPGLASPTALLKFGIACGVGASLKVLRKQTGGLFKMATTATYHPDRTIIGLAEHVAQDPHCRIAGVHYFPFGTLAATVPWARSLRDGMFTARHGRLQVTR